MVLLAVSDTRLGFSRRLAVRIFAQALGHDDLIDHDTLRLDPALMAAIDRPEDALAGKSTLNRLEHVGKIGRDRHNKLDHDMSSIERLFVDLFMDAHREPLVRIALDLDATDDPLHGEQEGRNFHGYYDCYCYLPLYIFCSRHLLCAKLRSSAKDAADGAREELARTVAQFRITKCQGDLFADRTPALTMRANQLRPWLASFAYVLTCAMRLIGLAGTKLEAATCGTIRLALLKVGALVTISVRRVQLAFASACPSRDVFMLAQWRLCG